MRSRFFPVRRATVFACLCGLVSLLPSAAGAIQRANTDDLDPYQVASKVMNSSGTLPSFVQFQPGKQPTFDGFLLDFLGTLPLSREHSFREVATFTDQQGENHHRLQQIYRGVPVYGAEYIVHERGGSVRAANGQLAGDIGLAPTPVLMVDRALPFALARIAAKEYKWQSAFWMNELRQKTGNPNATWFPHGELVWAPSSIGDPGKVVHYSLAWSFDIEQSNPTRADRVFVDATTGAIVGVYPLQSNCDAASVNTIFSGSRSISTDKYTGTNWRLRDDCASPTFRIRDWGSSTLSSSPFEVENTSNTWTTTNERFGGTVLWETVQAYHYYLSKFSRASYDNSNGSVEGYINAVFDCSPPSPCTYTDNASMSFSGGQMLVGLGSSGTLANSWSAPDIISHEFTHAVTGSSAKLTYANESGALNESFSDCMGEDMELYDTGSNDWLEGAARTSGAIRSFINPKAFNDPDTYQGTNWYTGSNDNGGVHTNSGVQNHWFYLLAVGGSGTNDNGWAFSVNGIGIDKAARIAYRNLTVYLTSSSTYTDARTGSIAAAGDLYGAGSNEQTQVIRAWRAVGIDPCQITCPGTISVSNIPGACAANATFSVTDNGQCYSVNVSPASGALFAVGSNSVTATSRSGASCSFTVQVNDTENPTATCLPPLQVECTSHSGTPASDPAIAAWLGGFSAADNCPGVTKSNDAPGTFPHGLTTVTFTARDVTGNTSSCTSDLTVVDTTPPTLACPTDLTLECDSHCDASLGGVPETDAAVVAWLGSFSASDLCDATLATSLPHPACFPLGDTPVTFTATDDDGNTSSCTRTVHVVDTTPPAIAVALSRDALWPPNHKMATIDCAVDVTDVCDPHPFFQLMSIASNEPDNGLGDGDTANDIQGASYGTADTEFQLRSERSGTGSGREYTITYRAFDHAGNTTDNVSTVRVDHNQNSSVLAAGGFNPEGTDFLGGATTFTVVIRTVPPGDTSPGGTSIGTIDLNQPVGAPVDARFVDPDGALIGNTAGALMPISSTRYDADGDGNLDLVCTYDLNAALAIRSVSDALDGPLALHFSDQSGQSFLASDLFGLGASVSLPDLQFTPVEQAWTRSGGGTTSATRVANAPAAASATVGSPATPTIVAAGTAPVVTTAAVSRTQLSAVYPVPMHNQAVVAFALARDQFVDLSIYDVRGARVRTLRTGPLAAGRHEERWDARDDSGRLVGGGIYFVRMSAGAYRGTWKTIVMP